MTVTSINGTEEEAFALNVALAHSCTCDAEANYRCPSCIAASTDQRWLNRMLFMRRKRRDTLIAAEFKEKR